MHCWNFFPYIFHLARGSATVSSLFSYTFLLSLFIHHCGPLFYFRFSLCFYLTNLPPTLHFPLICALSKHCLLLPSIPIGSPTAPVPILPSLYLYSYPRLACSFSQKMKETKSSETLVPVFDATPCYTFIVTTVMTPTRISHQSIIDGHPIFAYSYSSS
jgi:hypothetical protein